MNTTQIREYHRNRSKGYGAKLSYGIATQPDSGIVLDTPFVVDGFTVVASAVYDEYADVSHLGSFTDTWSEGCHDRFPNTTFFRNEYRYIELENSPVASDWPKLGKVQAREEAQRVRQDGIDWLEAWASGHTTLVWVLQVVASFDGIELGHDSLGGVDLALDCPDPERELARMIDESGMVATAIDEARARLTTLCRKQGVA